MALAFKHKIPAIAPEEMERRRKMVRSAFRSNAMEGLRPNPACQPVFDAYIAGEIELEEIMSRCQIHFPLRLSFFLLRIDTKTEKENGLQSITPRPDRHGSPALEFSLRHNSIACRVAMS